GFDCASTPWAIISASPDSDVPHVLSDRDTIAPCCPDRASRSGRTCSLIISCISYGTPGTAYTTLSPMGALIPGAVPTEFGMGSAPTGTSHWRRLFSGIARPRDVNSADTHSTR